MIRIFQSVIVALLVGMAACASATSGSGSGTSIPVHVENEARSDLDVTALIGQQEIRLGRAQVGQTGRFRLSTAMLTATPYAFAVRLVARDGTGTFTTPVLTVHEGQGVYIDAGPTLNSSRYNVR